MIKRTIFSLLFLAGCITTIDSEDLIPPPLKEKPTLKYKVGQCVNVFDPETGKGRPDEIVRVEAIYEDVYYYRWWLPQKEWALDINHGIGKYETFEKMTYLAECPK